MNNFTKALIVIGVVVLQLAGVGQVSAQQDDDVDLVFTGCPPYVEGSHCDSLFYQVVAVDIKTGKVCPGVKYHLVSGPGTINSQTGLWVFHPQDEEPNPYHYYEVEIAASHGNDSTSGDENCRFEVRVFNNSPQIKSYCGAHLTVLPLDTIVIPVEIYDPDWCDEVSFNFSVDPRPVGELSFDESAGLLLFAPAEADRDRTFTATFTTTDGIYSRECLIYFDVFPLAPIRMRVETEHDAHPGDEVQLAIVLDETLVEFGRFDLVVVFDPTRLQFLRAIGAPEFYDELHGCGWEYFRTGFLNTCSPDQQEQKVRISAIADLRQTGPPHPSCYLPDQLPARLALLDFRVSDAPVEHEEFIPISFYWCDCRDNVLYSVDNRIYYYSSAVFDHTGELIEPGPVPGYSGASDECYLNPYRSGGPERFRQVEYHNGGVQVYCNDTVLSYGDINLNGISFEIADAMMFLNYFIEGLAAFPPDYVEASIAASDINRDGIPLTIEDFVYLVRIVEGNALPPGSSLEPSPNIAELSFDPATNVYSIITPDSMGAIYMVLEGNVTPTLLVSNAEMAYRFDGTNTKIIIFDGFTGSSIPSGPFLSVSGASSGLVIIEVATYLGRKIIVCAADPHCQPGDVNGNGVAFEIADAVLLTNYFIIGWSVFEGMDSICVLIRTDTNRDGIPLTVEDLVFILRVIMGNESPSPSTDPSPNIAYIWQDIDRQVVTLDTPDTLGAVVLVFDGEIVPEFPDNGTIGGWDFDGEKTRILIYSLTPGVWILSGELFTYTGAGILEEGYAATYDARLVTVVIGQPTNAADDANGSLPTEFTLHQNYPNPFNPVTTIQYDLPQRSAVDIVIYNISGQTVKRLVGKVQPAGRHTVQWNGTDQRGKSVSSGIYLYRIMTEDFNDAHKMILLR